jgi:hypothetical protein
MASILKVDKIVDSGSNVLATSSGSGYAVDSGVTIPAAGITGTLGSGVTIGDAVTLPSAATQGLGIGQTQTDVTSSRAVNTTYTNSTGDPIYVNLTVSTGTGSDSRWEIDGVVNPGGTYTNSSGGRNNLTAVVPNGQTYKVVLGGNGAIISWMELK